MRVITVFLNQLLSEYLHPGRKTPLYETPPCQPLLLYFYLSLYCQSVPDTAEPPPFSQLAPYGCLSALQTLRTFAFIKRLSCFFILLAPLHPCPTSSLPVLSTVITHYVTNLCFSLSHTQSGWAIRPCKHGSQCSRKVTLACSCVSARMLDNKIKGHK